MDPQYAHEHVGIWRLEKGKFTSKTVLAQLGTSTFISGYTKRELMSFRVTLTPGWESPWRVLKTCRRMPLGTKGLGFPVDTSQSIVSSLVGKGGFWTMTHSSIVLVRWSSIACPYRLLR